MEMVVLWNEAAGGLVPGIRARLRVYPTSVAQFQEPRPLYTQISLGGICFAANWKSISKACGRSMVSASCGAFLPPKVAWETGKQEQHEEKVYDAAPNPAHTPSKNKSRNQGA
jgi:hypothetical protein